MKRSWIFTGVLICIIFSGLAFSAPKWVTIRSSQEGPPQSTLTNNTSDSVVFIVTIPGFYKEDINWEDTTYQKLRFPTGTTLTDSGFPELPTVAHSIAIPNCEGVTVTVNAYNPTYLTDYYYQVNIKQN